MNFSNRFDYGYATGRIKALEKKILSQKDIERLILARDVETFVAELHETYLKEYITKLTQKQEFEFILQTIEETTIKEIKSLSKDKPLISLILLYIDIHNIKLILKEFFTQSKSEEHLKNYGSISIEKIRQCIYENKFQEIPAELSNIIKQLLKNYEENKNIRNIENYIDKLFFKLYLKNAQKLKSEFIISFVKTSIDFYNILLLLRIKYLKKELKDFNELLTEQGFIPTPVFKELFIQEFHSIIDYLKKTKYEKIFQKLSSENVQELIKSLEKNIYNYIFELCKITDFIIFGFEPLFSFFIKKQNEIKVLRTVHLLKKQNFPPESIKNILS